MPLLKRLLLCIAISAGAGAITYFLTGLKKPRVDAAGSPVNEKALTMVKERRAVLDDEQDGGAGSGNKPKVTPLNVWRGGPPS